MTNPMPTPYRRARRVASAALLSTALVGIAASAGWHQALAQQQPAPATAALIQHPIVDPGYADLVAAVRPAVVNVRIEKSGDDEGQQTRSPMDDPELRRFFERFFGQLPPGAQPQHPPQAEKVVGEGSGFVISPTGYIVTNAHVAGGASKIEVSFSDEKKMPAKLVGIDEKTDLAVLKVDAGHDLPYVPFGDSAKVRVGDKVVAVGNPFGLGGTVTSGIVSATNREIGSGPYDDFLQIDAAINRGNSGGPTFDLGGEVIGVNSAIFSPNGGSVGIGFAIASNQAKQVVDELIKDGKVERGWLGVSIQPVDEDLAKSLDLAGAGGALINEVQPDGPAQKAGLERGDVVTKFNDQAIGDPRQLSRVVAAADPDQPAKVTVWRDGKERVIDVTLAEQPNQQQVASNDQGDEGQAQPRLGLSLAPLNRESRQQLDIPADKSGVVVADVTSGSPADEKGIQPGDVIMAVDRQPVKEPRQVIDAVKKAAQGGDKSVLLLVLRDGRQFFEAIPLAAS